MSTSPSVVTVSFEYAKSGRSTCKGCGAAIASGALRLGASTRDPRGFDSTKWYHVACFPVASHPLGPVESIAGFDAIKDDDREELRELEKNRKTGHTDSGSLDEPSPKKVKTQGSSPAEEVSDKASVSVEYAKSGRSTCKGCNENIVKGSLRIGASFHDPRGFENTKWYHVTCFPTSLYPVFPVEHLKGFDSLEDHDRKKLQKLEKAQNMRDSKDGTEKNMEEVKASVRALDEPSPKKVKGVGVSGDTNISVEYAKSGRSTCKGCNENISKGALRLGASAHDPRGFDSTKWYHVGCFPTSSYPVFRVENLKGFDSIENQDREKVRELEENSKTEGNASDQLTELNLKNEMAQNMGDSKDRNERNLEEVKSLLLHSPKQDGDREELRELEKNRKRGNAAVSTLDKPSPKKVKRVSEKSSVSVEYAKSGRSTCKDCSKNIAKGALRLGSAAHDPRGFDSTKWYHVACFPASSYPVFPVENLKGFDFIKNEDRDKLRELEEKQKEDDNEVDQSNEPNLKNERVDNMGDSEEGAGKTPEEVKLLARHKGIDPLLSFSVSEVKDMYKGATLPAHWKVFDTVIFREKEDGLHASAKIAAFDFDGCLAKTSVRCIGADKWSLQHKSIPEKLQKLYNDGYKLVIFTNESNIERWKNKRQVAIDSKVGRLDQFIECVKVPIQIFIACGLGKGKDTPDDQYRKPNPGMWWLMARHFNSGVKIDMDQSFYVGDAAGREADHSDADIEFAKAIGLKFNVPEEYFGC